MSWQLSELLQNPIYVGIGASLGFLATAVNIYQFFKQGPRITVVPIDTRFVLDNIKVTGVENDNQVDLYSATFHLKLQIQNEGTDLTSVVSTTLALSDGNKYNSKIFVPIGKTNAKRTSDDRTIAIQSGEAVVAEFEFDVVDSRIDFSSKKISGKVVIEFVKHKSKTLELVFTPK